MQLSLELKHLLSKIEVVDRIPFQEVSVWNGCLKKFDTNLEKMVVEDLCAMDRATEEKITALMQKRLANGESYSFAGDVLVAVNSNVLPGDIPDSVWILVVLIVLILLYNFSSESSSFFLLLICQLANSGSSTRNTIVNRVRRMHRIYFRLPIAPIKICCIMRSHSISCLLAKVSPAKPRI